MIFLASETPMLKDLDIASKWDFPHLQFYHFQCTAWVELDTFVHRHQIVTMPMQTAPAIDATVSLDSRLSAENAVGATQYIRLNTIHVSVLFTTCIIFILTMFLSYFSSIKHDWDSWNAMSN